MFACWSHTTSILSFLPCSTELIFLFWYIFEGGNGRSLWLNDNLMVFRSSSFLCHSNSRRDILTRCLPYFHFTFLFSFLSSTLSSSLSPDILFIQWLPKLQLTLLHSIYVFYYFSCPFPILLFHSSPVNQSEPGIHRYCVCGVRASALLKQWRKPR